MNYKSLPSAEELFGDLNPKRDKKLPSAEELFGDLDTKKKQQQPSAEKLFGKQTPPSQEEITQPSSQSPTGEAADIVKSTIRATVTAPEKDISGKLNWWQKFHKNNNLPPEIDKNQMYDWSNLYDEIYSKQEKVKELGQSINSVDQDKLQQQLSSPNQEVRQTAELKLQAYNEAVNEYQSLVKELENKDIEKTLRKNMTINHPEKIKEFENNLTQQIKSGAKQKWDDDKYYPFAPKMPSKELTPEQKKEFEKLLPDKLEKKILRSGLSTNIAAVDAVLSGILRMGAGGGKIPVMLSDIMYDAAAAPQNAIASILKIPELRAPKGKELRKAAGNWHPLNWLDKEAKKQFKLSNDFDPVQKKFKKSFYDYIKTNEWQKAGEWFGLNMLAQAPQLIETVASYGLGGAPVALGTLTAQASGMGKLQLEKENKLPENIQQLHAVASGGIEYFTEQLGSMQILKRIYRNRAAKEGVETGIKNVFTNLFKSSREEGSEELIGGVADYILDAATGNINIEDKTLKGLTKQFYQQTPQILTEGMLGAAGGFALSGGGEVMNSIYRKTNYDKAVDQSKQLIEGVKNNEIDIYSQQFADNIHKIKKMASVLPETKQKEVSKLFKTLEKEVNKKIKTQSQKEFLTNRTIEQTKAREETIKANQPKYIINGEEITSKEEFLTKLIEYPDDKNTPEIRVINDTKTSEEAQQILQDKVLAAMPVEQAEERRLAEIQDKVLAKEELTPEEKKIWEEQQYTPEGFRYNEQGELEKTEKTKPQGEYFIGDKKYDNVDEFMTKVMEYQGKKNTPKITVNNDTRVSKAVKSILQPEEIEQKGKAREINEKKKVKSEKKEVRSEKGEGRSEAIPHIIPMENPKNIDAFGKGLYKAKYSGKLYHSTDIDGLLNLINVFDKGKYISTSTENAEKLFDNSVIVEYLPKERDGLYSSVDADSGKNMGYDEFRTKQTDKSQINKIYLNNELYRIWNTNYAETDTSDEAIKYDKLYEIAIDNNIKYDSINNLKLSRIKSEKKKVRSEKGKRSKEPWEMTKEEWNVRDDTPITIKLPNNQDVTLTRRIVSENDKNNKVVRRVAFVQQDTGQKLNGERIHKKAIEQALAEGKEVPKEVLKEYPKLKEQANGEMGKVSSEQTNNDFDQEMAKVDRQNKKIDEFIAKHHEVPFKGKTRSGRDIFITRDPNNKKWRLTYTNNKGIPSGHTEFDSYKKVIKEAVHNYKTDLSKADIRIAKKQQRSEKGEVEGENKEENIIEVPIVFGKGKTGKAKTGKTRALVDNDYDIYALDNLKKAISEVKPKDADKNFVTKSISNLLEPLSKGEWDVYDIEVGDKTIRFYNNTEKGSYFKKNLSKLIKKNATKPESPTTAPQRGTPTNTTQQTTQQNTQQNIRKLSKKEMEQLKTQIDKLLPTAKSGHINNRFEDNKEEFGTVNIKLGNVEYEVINHKKTLNKILNRSKSKSWFPSNEEFKKKQLKTTAAPNLKGTEGIVPATKKPLASRRMQDIEDVEYYNIYKPKKATPLRGTEANPILRTTSGYAGMRNWMVKDEFIEHKGKVLEPKKLTFDFQNESPIDLLADFSTIGDNKAYVHAVAKDGRDAIFPAENIDQIYKHLDNPKAYLAQLDNYPVLIFKKNGETQGFSMPADIELPSNLQPRKQEVLKYENRPQFKPSKQPALISQFKQVLDTRFPKSMKTQSVRNFFKKHQAKDVEMDWIGLDEFLEGKNKVTREELQNFYKLIFKTTSPYSHHYHHRLTGKIQNISQRNKIQTVYENNQHVKNINQHATVDLTEDGQHVYTGKGLQPIRNKPVNILDTTKSSIAADMFNLINKAEFSDADPHFGLSRRAANMLKAMGYDAYTVQIPGDINNPGIKITRSLNDAEIAQPQKEYALLQEEQIQEAQTDIEKIAEVARTYGYKGQEPQIVNLETPTEMQAAAAEFITALTGNQPVWVSNQTFFEGVNYHNKIFLRENTQEPLSHVVLHEAMHQLKRIDPFGYKDVLNIVKSHAKINKTFEKKLNALYTSDNIKYTDDGIYDEFLSDLVGSHANDISFWNKVAKKAPTAMQNLIKAVKNTFAKLKQIFINNSNIYDEIVESETKVTEILDKAAELIGKNLTATISGTEINYNPEFLLLGNKATEFQQAKEKGLTFTLKKDNKERFALLPQTKLRLPQNITETITTKLKDILVFDEFYRNYPQAADIDVVINPLSIKLKNGEVADGSFKGKNKISLAINREALSDEKQIQNIHNTLFHELQHVIQDYEGFASGGNLIMDWFSASNFDGDKILENFKNIADDYNMSYNRLKTFIEREIPKIHQIHERLDQKRKKHNIKLQESANINRVTQRTIKEYTQVREKLEAKLTDPNLSLTEKRLAQKEYEQKIQPKYIKISKLLINRQNKILTEKEKLRQEYFELEGKVYDIASKYPRVVRYLYRNIMGEVTADFVGRVDTHVLWNNHTETNRKYTAIQFEKILQELTANSLVFYTNNTSQEFGLARSLETKTKREMSLRIPTKENTSVMMSALKTQISDYAEPYLYLITPDDTIPTDIRGLIEYLELIKQTQANNIFKNDVVSRRILIEKTLMHKINGVPFIKIITTNTPDVVWNYIGAHLAETQKFDEIPKFMPAKSQPRESKVAVNKDNKFIKTRFEVLEAKDLILSHKEDYTINPNFPQKYQARERSRSEYKLEVDQRAQNLSPLKLADNILPQYGSPIVANDSNIVESGNGRGLSIIKTYHDKTLQNKADEYRRYLYENADVFGIDPNDVLNMEEPVLVRRRDKFESEKQREEFIKFANTSEIQTMSEYEVAISDANQLTEDMLELMEESVVGDLSNVANREFIQSFIENIIPASEYNQYVGAKGNPTTALYNRVRNAIFAKAFPSQEGLLALQIISEAPEDSGIKSLTNFMISAAPKLARLKTQIKNGIRYDYDISNEIAEAIIQIKNLRENNQTVEEYMQEMRLFRIDSPLKAYLLELLDEYKGSKVRKLTNFINDYISQVNEIGDPHQNTLFDTTDNLPTREELLKAVVAENTKSSQQSQLVTTSNEYKNIADDIRSQIKTFYKTPSKKVPMAFINRNERKTTIPLMENIVFKWVTNGVDTIYEPYAENFTLATHSISNAIKAGLKTYHANITDDKVYKVVKAIQDGRIDEVKALTAKTITNLHKQLMEKSKQSPMVRRVFAVFNEKYPNSYIGSNQWYNFVQSEYTLGEDNYNNPIGADVIVYDDIYERFNKVMHDAIKAIYPNQINTLEDAIAMSFLGKIGAQNKSRQPLVSPTTGFKSFEDNIYGTMGMIAGLSAIEDTFILANDMNANIILTNQPGVDFIKSAKMEIDQSNIDPQKIAFYIDPPSITQARAKVKAKTTKPKLKDLYRQYANGVNFYRSHKDAFELYRRGSGLVITNSIDQDYLSVVIDGMQSPNIFAFKEGSIPTSMVTDAQAAQIIDEARTKAIASVKSKASKMQNVDSELKERLKKLRHIIYAIKGSKKLTNTEFVKITKRVTGLNSIKASAQTPASLESLIKAIKKRRPRKIKTGKNVTTYETVITKKTENQIQSLKEAMINNGTMTEEYFNKLVQSISRSANKPPRYINSNVYWTEKQGKELIETMLKSALFVKTTQTKKEALNKYPLLQNSVQKISDYYLNKYKNKMPKHGNKLPNPTIVEDMRYYMQDLSVRTGIPIYDLWYTMIEVAHEADYMADKKKAELPNAIGQENLNNIITNKQALQRVENYLRTEQKPAGITNNEVKLAKKIREILDDYKNYVREERFYLWYNWQYRSGKEHQIKDATDKQLRDAVKILQTQGHEALKKHLDQQTWGVINYGYAPDEVIHPTIKTVDVKANVKHSNIEYSKEMVFNEQDRNIMQRLYTYINKAERRKYLRPYIEAYSAIADEVCQYFEKPYKVANTIENNLKEITKVRTNQTLFTKLLRVFYSQWAKATFSVDPRKGFRNTLQNLGFYFHPEDLAPNRLAKLTEEEAKYFISHVALEKGITQDFLYKNETWEKYPITGKIYKLSQLEHLNKAADKINMMGRTDKWNRDKSFRASLGRTQRVLAKYPNWKTDSKQYKAFFKEAKLNDLRLSEIDKALSIAAQEGDHQMALYIAKTITEKIHFIYERMGRAPFEQGGELQRLATNLLTFRRGFAQRLIVDSEKFLPGEKELRDELFGDSTKLQNKGKAKMIKGIARLVLGITVNVGMLFGRGWLVNKLYALVTDRDDKPYDIISIVAGMFSLFGAIIDTYNDIADLPPEAYRALREEDTRSKNYQIRNLQNKILSEIPKAYIPFARNILEVIHEMFYKERKTSGRNYDYSIYPIIEKAYRTKNYPKVAEESVKVLQTALFATNHKSIEQVLERKLNNIKEYDPDKFFELKNWIIETVKNDEYLDDKTLRHLLNKIDYKMSRME
jgi:hypothetical protein